MVREGSVRVRAEISYAQAEINLEITGYFWKSSRNQLKGNQKSEVSRAAHAQAHGISGITRKSLWKSEITLKLSRNLESGNLEITWKSGNHMEIWRISGNLVRMKLSCRTPQCWMETDTALEHGMQGTKSAMSVLKLISMTS